MAGRDAELAEAMRRWKRWHDADGVLVELQEGQLGAVRRPPVAALDVELLLVDPISYTVEQGEVASAVGEGAMAVMYVHRYLRDT